MTITVDNSEYCCSTTVCIFQLFKLKNKIDFM